MTKKMSEERRFITGPLKGTKIEIMPSKAATKLSSGALIKEYDYDNAELTPTQVCHRLGKIDVHQPQSYTLEDRKHKTKTVYVGPSIAQEWKLLYQGKRPFYQVEKPS